VRFKPPFSAAQQPQRTAENRKYTAKTAKEPYWPQSKRHSPATFPNTTTLVYHIKSVLVRWHAACRLAPKSPRREGRTTLLTQPLPRWTQGRIWRTVARLYDVFRWHCIRSILHPNPAEPVQWLRHFGHHNRSFYVCTYVYNSSWPVLFSRNVQHPSIGPYICLDARSTFHSYCVALYRPHMLILTCTANSQRVRHRSYTEGLSLWWIPVANNNDCHTAALSYVLHLRNDRDVSIRVGTLKIILLTSVRCNYRLYLLIIIPGSASFSFV